MKLNITLIGVNFLPEDTAIGLYSTQMAQYLESRGHQINIITGFPYYPQWEIHKDYKSKSKFFEESLDQIRVLRYKQYVPQNPTFFKRIIHLLDFTIGSFFNLRKISNADLVICVVPFTSSILLGWWLKRKTKAKLWIHIQDFEFDAAVQAGVSRNKNRIKNLIFKLLFWIEKMLLNSADIGSTISFTMVNKFQDKSNLPIVYFPNWIDADKINPNKAKEHPFLGSSKFKVLYSGNVGDKQDWELFVNLVNKLESCNDIEFVVVGDGAKFQWLTETIGSNQIVSFHKPVPYEELSDLLCSTDLHILFQKTDVVDTVMPSKLLGMMASGKPSIVTGNPASEVKQVLNKSKGGIYLDTNNLDELIEALTNLMENQEKAKLMGSEARIYVEKIFGKDQILANLEEQIFKVLD
ncbi:WcaI family glycosyltransferase [Muriicola sp. SD30]|uniref:WcaI family glycosyltransferase n=1 Tax=Muriicola sp. SD30 TaxID=3240936 RepID=UPI00350F6CE4